MTRVNELLKKRNSQHATDPRIMDLGLDHWFTGSELENDSEQLQAALLKAGLGRGDVVLVALPNSAAYFVLDQAAWALGMAVHPLSPTTPVSELLGDRDEHHYPALLVTSAMAAKLGDIFTTAPLKLKSNPDAVLMIASADLPKTPDHSPAQEDDIALIMATSGTTGKPKRVGLTHRLIYNTVGHIAPSNRMSASSVALITMPLFHINSQVTVGIAMQFADGKMVIAPKFSASRYWNWVADNGVTWTAVVPTMISILLQNERANAVYQERQDEVHLEFVRSSSFALPEIELNTFQDRFHTHILEGYGMTESTGQSTINPFDAAKIGSAGKAVGTTMALRQTDGTFTTKPGVVGEIALKGDHVITHYLDPHPDAFIDGWFMTGDLGHFDEDGYLYVTGRTKEIISHGGEKVAPAHVENVLDALPFIAQLCVIGTPDKLYGEAVTAAIVSTTPGENEDEQRKTVLAYGAAHLAKFEAPTRVVFMTSFPRNQTGKVLRPKLRKMLEAINVH